MAASPNRRQVLQTAAVAGGLSIAPFLYAAGDDTLKIGLVGCGGRGTGAAAQALKADRNVKLVALGDAFEDRLSSCLNTLQADEEVRNKVQVPAGNRFVGFDAYKNVIASSDVVLLCTTPHFRPLHLKAAIDAGKHVFAEKPVAVDAPGVRSVLATCEQAKKKNLSVVSGLCLRYDYGFQETVKRLQEGAIGDIRIVQANDYRGGRWKKPREEGQTDMEYQMRNWYNFTWLSGDFNVEQHVHFLDVCSWIMKEEYPVKAVGMGGRQVFTGPEYGNIYDHFSIVYEYASGARLFSNTRQHPNTANDMSAQAFGTRGRADISERKKGLIIRTTGSPEWVYTGRENQMYQTEHDELFASIRAGKPINNGEYMSRSTLLAIMGRMAAYTGQAITWEMALNSKEDLTPASYDWQIKLPDPPIAIPGVTRFS
jgi:predicted dehydrogenase